MATVGRVGGPATALPSLAILLLLLRLPLPPPPLLPVLPLLGPLPFSRPPRSASPSLGLAPAVAPMPVALEYPQHLLSGKVSRAFEGGKGYRKEAQFPFAQDGHCGEGVSHSGLV